MRPNDGFYFDGTKLVPIDQMALRRKPSTVDPTQEEAIEKGQGTKFKNMICVRNV